MWASHAQIEELFAVVQSDVSRHIRSILRDAEVDRESNMQKAHIAGADRPVTLAVGANTITTVVIAQNSASKSYSVTVTRAASGNSDLSGITLSAGSLSPAFSAATTGYTTTVGYSVDEVALGATLRRRSR